MCPAGLTLSISNLQCQTIGETALLPVPFLVPILFHLLPHLDDFQQSVKILWSTVIHSSLSLIDYAVYQNYDGQTATIMHDLSVWGALTLLKAEACIPTSYLPTVLDVERKSMSISISFCYTWVHHKFSMVLVLDLCLYEENSIYLSMVSLSIWTSANYVGKFSVWLPCQPKVLENLCPLTQKVISVHPHNYHP